MRRLWPVALAGVLLGCAKTSPSSADAGTILTVPGGYHFAKMAPGHRAHLALQGADRVACRDCHTLADAGFAAPPVAICAGCHEDQERQHHPLDGGAEMTCLTCHVFKAEAAPMRFETWGCMDCHREAQGKKIAIEVHLERCASCHRPHRAPFTEAGDCSTCHEVRLTHGERGPSVAKDCMTCHPPHQAAVVASGQCLECHQKANIPTAARVSPLSIFPGHPGCGACHTAHTFQKSAIKPCISCHQRTLVLAADSHKGCPTCHLPHQPRAKARPCEQCHRKVVATNAHPAPEKGQACLGCHPAHPASALAPMTVPCVTCHQKIDAKVVHAATLSCEGCHKPHTGKVKREVLCVTCHEVQVLATRKNRDHADCNACHEGLPHGGHREPRPCLSCHEDATPPQKGHPDCASCHASHSAAVIKTCSSCHLTPTSPPLPGLHATQKHRECATCHAPHTPEPGSGPKTCMSCHSHLPRASHPTPPTQCVSCHLFRQEK